MSTWNGRTGQDGLRSFTDEHGNFWLEQNSSKTSKWAKFAKRGHDVAWEFGANRRYTGRMLDDGRRPHACRGYEEVLSSRAEDLDQVTAPINLAFQSRALLNECIGDSAIVHSKCFGLLPGTDQPSTTDRKRAPRSERLFDCCKAEAVAAAATSEASNADEGCGAALAAPEMADNGMMVLAVGTLRPKRETTRLFVTAFGQQRRSGNLSNP